MKITIIGAGSSYTPELIEGLINRQAALGLIELALVDIDQGMNKLEIIDKLTRRMFDQAGKSIVINSGVDRRTALAGSDYVITQIRVGGLAARALDERIPTEHGVLGQETTGAGGMAKALRTIPVILDIAKDMEELCPDAWLINFTNPSGMVTEAVLKNFGIRCLGLCNAPMNMYRSLVNFLKLEPAQVQVRYLGLNHLSWISRIWIDGRDKTDELYENNDLIAHIAESLGPEPVNREIVRTSKLIPSYYLKYFYHPSAQISTDQQALADGRGTRAVQVGQVEQDLFQIYADEATDTKPEQLSMRGGAWYSEAALSLIQSLELDEGKMHIVNVLNNGAIDDLPDDCVIETNCFVDKTGAKPLAAGRLPRYVSALVQSVKCYEQLAIEAAITGSRDLALTALIQHPLLPDAETAEVVLDKLLLAHREYLPRFFR